MRPIYQALLCSGPWSVETGTCRVPAHLGVPTVPRATAPGKRQKNFSIIVCPGRSDFPAAGEVDDRANSRGIGRRPHRWGSSVQRLERSWSAIPPDSPVPAAPAPPAKGMENSHGSKRPPTETDSARRFADMRSLQTSTTLPAHCADPLDLGPRELEMAHNTLNSNASTQA